MPSAVTLAVAAWTALVSATSMDTPAPFSMLPRYCRLTAHRQRYQLCPARSGAWGCVMRPVAYCTISTLPDRITITSRIAPRHAEPCAAERAGQSWAILPCSFVPVTLAARVRRMCGRGRGLCGGYGAASSERMVTGRPETRRKAASFVTKSAQPWMREVAA